MNISKYFYTMRNLFEIKRYQNKVNMVPRTIAEHKFAYIKIAYMIAYWENKLGNKVDVGKLLEKGILSGTIKAITGDIQNNTIEATPNMKSIITDTYERFYDTNYETLLPKEISDRVKSIVLNAKDSSPEGEIIRAASLINRFLECIDELSLSNSHKFKKILEDTAEELMSIDLVSVKLFFAELPNYISIHLINSSDRLKEIKRTIYSSIESRVIFEFSTTFYEYITEIRGLMGVQRYQNLFKHRKSSVAEHQWFVSLLSLFAYYYHDENVDLENLLVKALFHDDIELYTGDILSETKNALLSTKQEVEKVELKYYDDIYSHYIPSDINEYVKKNVLHPKDDTAEGKIMAFCDILDTVYECNEEILLGNSQNFDSILSKSMQKLKQFENDIPAISDFLPPM